MTIVELGRQSLGRALTASEDALAGALMAIFATGDHDFEQAVVGLQARGVVRPSGASGPWSVTALQDELQRINNQLDAAYTGEAPEPKDANHD